MIPIESPDTGCKLILCQSQGAGPGTEAASLKNVNAARFRIYTESVSLKLVGN